MSSTRGCRRCFRNIKTDPAMLTIGNESLKITLCLPDGKAGYYRGTRFDWAGVFESVVYDGCNYAEQWFEVYSPEKHDAVGGPAEEFGAVGFDLAAPGEAFLKIGVGMLERPDDQPYDRFRLHRILDYGQREFSASSDTALYRHVINSDSGYGYDYVKEICVTGLNTFSIRHKLLNTGTLPLKTDVYNHNFFTLGLLKVAEGRCLDFPYRPEGDWRDEYDHVAFTENGIRFSEPNDKVVSVFTGNLHEAGKGMSGSPSSFDVYETVTGRRVQARCALPMTKAVFWANKMVACVEPYLDFDIKPGEEFCFTIDYILDRL